MGHLKNIIIHLVVAKSIPNVIIIMGTNIINVAIAKAHVASLVQGVSSVANVVESIIRKTF